jgi:hypothetical protein
MIVSDVPPSPEPEMRWPQILLPALLMVSVLAASPANAWTEFLAMDGNPELYGWRLVGDGGVTSSTTTLNGIMTLNAERYREFWAPPTWITTVNLASGYIIEFRMRILQMTPCYPHAEVGFWYHDRTHLTKISVDPDRVYIAYPTVYGPEYALDARAWHTYTIVVYGTHHRLYVDGSLAIDYDHPPWGDGTEIFSFGDLGGDCPSSRTEWDYVAYDTAPVVPTVSGTWGKLKTLYRGVR